MLAKTLRAQVRPCTEEANFAEMYAALGDRDAQEEIRASNPTGRHCLDLLTTPNACIGCKHNPYKDTDLDTRVARDNALLTHWAIELGEYAELGLLPPLDQLSPQEVIAARLARRISKYEDYEIFAQLVAGKLAEVMAQIFGAK